MDFDLRCVDFDLRCVDFDLRLDFPLVLPTFLLAMLLPFVSCIQSISRMLLLPIILYYQKRQELPRRSFCFLYIFLFLINFGYKHIILIFK